MANEIRLAMLASSSGTTVEAILKAHNRGELPGIEPALIVAGGPDAGVIERARELKFDAVQIVERKQFASAKAFGQELLDLFKAFGINLVGQYGWLPKTPRNVIKAFDNGQRIINQHPGPVPWFGGKDMYGIRVHAAVLRFVLAVRERGRKCYGTYVVAQRVAPEYDQGEVLCYRAVPILPDDTPEELQKRALPEEWRVQIETLQRFAQGYTGVTPMAPFVFPGEEELWQEAVQFGQAYRTPQGG